MPKLNMKKEILSLNVFEISLQEVLDVINEQPYSRKHAFDVLPKYIVTDKGKVTETYYYLQFLDDNSGHYLSEKYYVFDISHMSHLLEYEMKECVNFDEELESIIEHIDMSKIAYPWKDRLTHFSFESHIVVEVTYEGIGDDIEMVIEVDKIL